MLDSLLFSLLNRFGDFVDCWHAIVVKSFFNDHDFLLLFVLSKSIKTRLQEVLVGVLFELKCGNVGSHHVPLVLLRFSPSLHIGPQFIEALSLHLSSLDSELIEADSQQLILGERPCQHMKSYLLVHCLGEVYPSFKCFSQTIIKAFPHQSLDSELLDVVLLESSLPDIECSLDVPFGIFAFNVPHLLEGPILVSKVLMALSKS